MQDNRPRKPILAAASAGGGVNGVFGRRRSWVDRVAEEEALQAGSHSVSLRPASLLIGLGGGALNCGGAGGGVAGRLPGSR